LKVPMSSSTRSSLKILSRSPSAAWTAMCGSKARMPKCIAVAEYQTSTSVESLGGDAVSRHELREAGEDGRLLPLRLGEAAVHLERELVEPRRTDLELVLSPVAHRPRRARRRRRA
jgi:hypothetical protein